MESKTDLQLRIDDLERQVLEMRRMLTRIEVQRASPRVGSELSMYTTTKNLGPDGIERADADGAIIGAGAYTALSVNGSSVQSRNGRDEWQLTTATDHHLHNQSRVRISGTSYDDDYRVVALDHTKAAMVMDLPEDFAAPSPGGVTAKVIPGAVKMTAYSIERGTVSGHIYSTEIAWFLPPDRDDVYLPSGSRVLVWNDPFSTKPDKSLMGLMAGSCWMPSNPDAAEP
jgi:hypothetical protein